MKQIVITLSGCDDHTDVGVEVTEQELEFLQKLSKLSHEACKYGCMPTMDVKEAE
jgi:hypothetical protein